MRLTLICCAREAGEAVRVVRLIADSDHESVEVSSNTAGQANCCLLYISDYTSDGCGGDDVCRRRWR